MSLHTLTQTLALTYIKIDSCEKLWPPILGDHPGDHFCHFYSLTLLQKQFPEEQVSYIILSILYSLKTSACKKTLMAWMAQSLYSVTSKEMHFGCDGTKSPPVFGVLVHPVVWLWRRVWNILYLPIFCPHN